MDRSLVSRGVIIVSVVLVATFAAFPPKDKISLGLDLQGGMHLVLQVETDDAIRAETDNTIDAMRQNLEDGDITGPDFDRTGDSIFQIRGVPADRVSFVKELVTDFHRGWTLRQVGDRLEMELTSSEAKSIRVMAVNKARETIRYRIDPNGVSEPIIHDGGLGSNRIVVQLPQVDDPERIRRLLKNTAFLEFRLVKSGTGPYGSEQQAADVNQGIEPDKHEIKHEALRDDDGKITGRQYWILEKRRVMTGRDLRTARSSRGQFNEPTVTFLLKTEGAKRFGEMTSANIGRNMAIVLDGIVISAPTIQGRITDQGVITGQFSEQEVMELVTVLRSGALPAGLTILEERTVGPTLGQDSIDKGSRAGLFGFGLVILTMVVVYKKTGLNAVLALLLNIVLVFGTMSIIGATLTLPGIAGIVLTIGMAVDANVLIFERIREELRSRTSVKFAIGAGFSKALSSIIDANATTMIAAIVLFMFGTGPIRGFAVTLSVGILASLFTAVFISRWLFDILTSRSQKIEKLSI